MLTGEVPEGTATRPSVIDKQSNDGKWRMLAGLRRTGDGAGVPPGAVSQIPYRDEERKADVRQGRLDGRRRIPSYTQLSDRIAADGSFTTVYSEQLQEVGHTRMRAERHAYRQVVAPKRRHIAGLREQLTTTAEEIERTEVALRETASELTPEELVPRSPLEAQRGPDFVRSRRRSMRTRQAEQAGERIKSLNKVTADIRRQIAEMCTEIVQDLERAKERVGMQATLTELRVKTYWAALTETHPEGRQLAVVVPGVRLESLVWPDDPMSDTEEDGLPEE